MAEVGPKVHNVRWHRRWHSVLPILKRISESKNTPMYLSSGSTLWIRLVGREVTDAGLRRIQPRHQRRSARAAPRRLIELCQLRPARSQGVNIRSINLSVVIT